MEPVATIQRFDAFLHREGLTLDAVVIGGTALGLLGVTFRHTRDCDILHPDLPARVREAAVTFARHSSDQGDPLEDSWLNNGPASLAEVLPPGWPDHVRTTLDDLRRRLGPGV